MDEYELSDAAKQRIEEAVIAEEFGLSDAAKRRIEEAVVRTVEGLLHGAVCMVDEVQASMASVQVRTAMAAAQMVEKAVDGDVSATQGHGGGE